MEPIGQKFKDARKEKGLFIEQVTRETNISKNYIEAIESEKFEEFPGEAYLLGFLRSYALYLGLDHEEIINIYKNTKIQENPVPVELIVTKKPFPFLPVAIAAGLLLVAGAGIYFFINKDNYLEKKVVEEKKPSKKTSVVQNKDSEISSGVEYVMDNTFVERNFAKGDSVIVNYKNTLFKILVKESSDGKVLLELPLETVELAKGKEILSDLDGDGTNDIRIVARDIDTAGKGTVLKFDRNIESPSVVSSSISSEEELSSVSASAVAANTASAAAPSVTTTTSAAGSTSVQSRKEKDAVIFESNTMQPFRVNINFKRYCLMRYEADNGAREEKYFNKGDTFRLDVSKQIKIWISNAQTVSTTINNVEYSFGTAGSVSSKIIGWNTNPSGGYAIKASPLY